MRLFTAHRFRRGAWRRFALALGTARETSVTIGMFVEMIVAVVVEPPLLFVVVVSVGMIVGCSVGRIVLIVWHPAPSMPDCSSVPSIFSTFLLPEREGSQGNLLLEEGSLMFHFLGLVRVSIPTPSQLPKRILKYCLVLAVAVCAPASFAYDPLLLSAANTPDPREFVFQDTARERAVALRIYLPEKKSVAPVLLFSHGLGGSRKGSAFLGRHWAARGYVAVFVQHPGSDDSVWRGKPVAERFASMSTAASVQNFTARVRDVFATLDQLEKWSAESGHELAGRLDIKRIGMSGHSFGAVTTQAVSGQKFPIGEPMTDARIKAALAFSPSKPAVGNAARAFGSVSIPWMLMTGTNDGAQIGSRSIGVADVASRLAVFPALPPGDKYEVVLDGANHFAFTDRGEFAGEGARNPNHHRVILALSTAFWDAFVSDDATAKTWLNSEAPRKLMEEKDRWQRK